MQHRRSLWADARNIQQVEDTFRRFLDDALPGVESAAIEKLQYFPGNRFTDTSGPTASPRFRLSQRSSASASARFQWLQLRYDMNAVETDRRRECPLTQPVDKTFARLLGYPHSSLRTANLPQKSCKTERLVYVQKKIESKGCKRKV